MPRFLANGALVAILTACVPPSALGEPESTEQAAVWKFESSNGLYRLELRPEEAPIEIGQYERWILTVTDAGDEPIYPARIAIGGGMEAHGHGLPTQPLVTAYGGDGEYLIEGLRFSMEGDWRLSFQIDSASGTDRADVKISIAY